MRYRTFLSLDFQQMYPSVSELVLKVFLISCLSHETLELYAP